METVEEIRNNVINKILAISNINFLEALDTLIVNSTDLVELTLEQKMILDLSDEDIKNGRMISQDSLIKRNTEWLNAI